jgi:acyl-coenzyme A thioesterase PaaI-like protein
VLRALALNREPGFHFIGNFAGVSFDSLAPGDTRVTLEPGAHCVDADGQANVGVVAMLADMALAASVRANLHPATRLATVSMSLQLTGARLEGRLEAAGEFQGFTGPARSRQGLARAAIAAPAGRVAIAQGSFMALDPPPGVSAFPLPRGPRTAPDLAERDLAAEERRILRHADRILAAGEADFLRRFVGYEPLRTRTGASGAMPGGAHVANRVGHVQGGLLMGLAASTSCAALPSSWALASISAFFVSPGQGKRLRARSRVLHHGLMTAVVRTEITGPEGRRVLEATTGHAHR